MLKHIWYRGETRGEPRRSRRPAVCLMSAFLCAFSMSAQFLVSPAARAQSMEPVNLQVQPQEGYGRMILTFKDRTLLPVYDAVITGGVLRISFENPIDINVDDVPLDLSDYITIARRDPDGSAIRFALKGQFQINTLEAGEKLFVDILPANWQGLPPGLPDDVVRELAKRAEEAMRKVRALEQARLKVKEGPQVTLHIGEHPTFTRLVFDWSVRFDTAFVREDDIVKVTFNHPAQLDVSDLRAHLPQGVVDATSFLDKGKLKFLMRIDPAVDIRAFREDQTYVIDVTPERMEPRDPANEQVNAALNAGTGGQGQQMIVAPGVRNTEPAPAPDTSAEGMLQPETQSEPVQDETALAMVPFNAVPGAAGAEQPAPAAEKVPSAPVPPKSQPAEDIAAAPASAPAKQDTAAQKTDDAAAKPVQDTVAAPAQVTPKPKPAKAEDTAMVDTAPQQATVGAPETARAPPPAEDMPASTPAGDAPAESTVGKTDEKTPDGAPQPAPTVAEAAQDPATPEPTAAPQAAEGADKLEMAAPEPVEVALADGNANDTVPPAMVLDDRTARGNVWRAKGGQEIPNSPETPPDDFADEVRNFVSAEARRIGKTVRVVFPFVEPVSSAVFRRNNSIWLVFDTDATIDIRGMVSALSDTADNIDVEQRDGYQILRMDMNDPVLATVGLDGNAWSLVIGDMILEPSIPLKMERNVRGDGGSVLRVLYKNPQNIREIDDPFVGDKISIVTGFGPPRGLLKPQKFVDLDVLSSAQGVAIVSRSDGVSMKLLGDDVIIEKTGGLSLSNRHLRGGTGTFNSIVDPNEPGYVEFVSLTTEGPATYAERLHTLEDNLSKAPKGHRRKARMDLARFYLAHQFAQEALGLMRLAVEEDPALAQDSAYHLMMGAAQTMAHHFKDAYSHLNRPDLKNSPDAAVWQTTVAVALNEWTEARIAMPRGRAVVGNYPKTIQAEFNLAAAQAMVEANDFGVANSVLAEIEPSEVTSSQAARYDILRGRVADASGRSQEALSAFDFVAKSDDRPRAAEAGYRALRIRYRDGEISIDEAIDQLAGLATSWRGDEIELKTLRFLSQLYAEKGQYREAFEAMKSAVQANPDSDTTRLLQEEMNGLFASLFLDGKADEMDPVKALALFYDFREMTPIGRQGDEMVRLLAKRLVEVDLLDQAIELLRHQVDNRLKGAARAQIAADLSALYLADRKPDEALRVLNLTRQASLPSTLERQRNIVEARALTASGRPDLALELVRNMRGSDVDRLRADTFWAAQSWREAGEQLEAMHGSRWSDTIPLDEIERRDILRAGIAYSLASDQLSLNRLQTKYIAKMADSPEASAFEVVTRPIDAQGVEFLAVANRLADTDTLETFLEEYRRQYMTPQKRNGDQVAATAPTG